ncbi:FAD-dependent oxidoreductase [Xanthobacter sp. TB0139]|uniref:FAD-dependent oxidoreductase n=1 Tax=Xanthobacter sp. TB0139 TaxID=3459178 RepID=UPI004039E194
MSVSHDGAGREGAVSGGRDDAMGRAPAGGSMPSEGMDARDDSSSSSVGRMLDCDICVVGDDLSGLLIACDLASHGYDVALVSPHADNRVSRSAASRTAEEPAAELPVRSGVLGFEASLSPGFSLPTADLVARLGREDAQELLALSLTAAERGLRYVTESGLPSGPRGRLLAARPHAAAALAAEHEEREALLPHSGMMLDVDQTQALLGSQTFSAALGVAHAYRVNVAALRTILEEAALQSEVKLVDGSTGLSADLNGVRKYINVGPLRVRAYYVVFSGGAELFDVAPALVPGLVVTPWVCGRFRLSEDGGGYHGLVDEFGSTGLRFYHDDQTLNVATETAFSAFSASRAARVLRRHARAVSPRISGLPTDAVRSLKRARPRERMPLVYEGEKGVWYCATQSEDEPAHGVLAADLIVGAIANRDDRIRLLQSFGVAASVQRPVGWLERVASYGYARLSRILPAGGDKTVAAAPPPALAAPAEKPQQPPAGAAGEVPAEEPDASGRTPQA